MDEKQKILLSDELTKQLINSPETGMGYHRVDLYLKNGEVLKNKIVLNCSILTLEKSININVENIEKLIVLQSLDFDNIKTKNMVKVLSNLNVDSNALIVLKNKNESISKSARNIPGIKTIVVDSINVFDILKYDSFIITIDAVQKIEEVYA